MANISKAEIIASKALAKGLPQSFIEKAASNTEMFRLSHFIMSRTKHKLMKENDKVMVYTLVMPFNGTDYEIGWTVLHKKENTGVGWINRDSFKILKKLPQIKDELRDGDEMIRISSELASYYGAE